MRQPLLLMPFLALSACTGTGAPVLFPGFEIQSAVTDPDYSQRRGAVELHVKTHHQAILNDIARGGGPALTQAFDIARVPAQDRPARILQLEGDRGLYEVNPGALVSALMVYG